MHVVKIKENPNVFITNNIYNYLDPEKIYIPIPEEAPYKKNDYLYKDTKFLLYNTSISGYITGEKKVYYNKLLVPALEITNDFKENIKSKRRKKNITNKDELIQVLEEYNLIEVAQKIKDLNQIKNLIISSIDDEIYDAKEFIILANYDEEILETIEFLQKVLEVNKATIVTKNTNAKSIKNVKSIIGTYPNIKINLVPDNYLIGYPQFLCEYLNIKEEDTLIISTSLIYDIYQVLKGKSILNNIITISGDNVEKSLIINTKLGVSLKELIAKFINIIDKDYEIYLNGYLKGIKIKKLEDIIITREINTIVINKKSKEVEEDCINCGACQRICPLNINVKYCYFHNLNSPKCISCGLCNYICPANLKLKEIVKSDQNEKEKY